MDSDYLKILAIREFLPEFSDINIHRAWRGPCFLAPEFVHKLNAREYNLGIIPEVGLPSLKFLSTAAKRRQAP